MNILQRLCRDCGNRTKPIKHGVGWCNVNDAPVPLAIPTSCKAFMQRDKTPLPDPPLLEEIGGIAAPKRTNPKTTTKGST